MEFIQVAFLQPGDKDFPDTGFPKQAHRVPAAIPKVEITDNAHTFGIGRPNRERRTLYAAMCDEPPAHFLVNFVMRARTEKVTVILRNRRLEGIRVVALPAMSRTIGIFQHVTEPFFPVLNDCLKETILMDFFHRVFFTLVDRIDDCNCLSPRQIGSYDHHTSAFQLCFMHPQNRMRIAMFSVHNVENFI